MTIEIYEYAGDLDNPNHLATIENDGSVTGTGVFADRARNVLSDYTNPTPDERKAFEHLVRHNYNNSHYITDRPDA